MKYFIGLVLLASGLMLLGINLGILRDIELTDFIIFWPILLVLLGVYLITKKWRFAAVIQTLVLIVSVIGCVLALPYAKQANPDMKPRIEIRTFRADERKNDIPQYEINGDSLDLFRAPNDVR